MTDLIDPAVGESVADALRWARATLAEAGVDGAPLDARVLLASVLACRPESVLSLRERPLGRTEATAYRRLIAGRAGRRPVSRLLGRRGFWCIELELDDAALDPRPDSETLVEAVLDRLADRRRPLRLLDLGVGSGCLLLALLHELPEATGVGVDRSSAALACARRNAVRLGLGHRVQFLAGDWATAINARFDAVVCNPPYIARSEIACLAPEVREHDPHLALDGGVDGLEHYRALALDLRRILAPRGFAAIECGAGQADQVAGILAEGTLAVAELRCDLAGVPRCLIVSGSDKG